MVIETPKKYYVTAEELNKGAEEYLSGEDLYLFNRACAYVTGSSPGQLQYVFGVTKILVDLRLDLLTILAALVWYLPSVVEIMTEHSRKFFKGEVLELVEEVQHLGRIEWNNWMTSVGYNKPPNRKEILKKMFLLAIGPNEEVAQESVLMSDFQKLEKQAENLTRLFLASASIHALIIKLADRLYFTKLLYYNALPEFQSEAINQRLYARITLVIYAPLADRLGMWKLKSELEDMSFRFLEPEKFKAIAEQLSASKAEREKSIAYIISIIQEKLTENGIQATISGRAKHIYSIHQKMEAKELTFEQIDDLLGIRIILKTVPDCYKAQGVLHGSWLPLTTIYNGDAGRDWIDNPKPNKYQSLHTTIQIGDKIVELQIRTEEMHEIAEYGVAAAHFIYKESKAYRKGKLPWKTRSKEQIWNEQLTELRKSLTNPLEGSDNPERNFLKGWIFVITPEGHVIDLHVVDPFAGATPLDFAYRIHSDLGNRYAGAKVNGNVVRLDYQLKNGDIVDLLPPRPKKAGPTLNWLARTKDETGRGYYLYARTSKARYRIRRWLKEHNPEKDSTDTAHKH